MSNSKRLFKNTVFMYVRMGVLMLISLYTSRVVLQILGVDDFGIYNLVGSVVALFSSLRGLFSSSTQRFLNYEMGRGNQEKLQTVFNMSVVINAIIAVVFIIGVEVVGAWFFANRINIDPSRLVAAQWVFQFSLVAAVISIMTTPFDATIIAHERMGFYAYMSIFEGILKLIIVYLLSVFDYDKLFIYGLLHLAVSIIVILCNAIYCRHFFPESHFRRCWDKQYFKKMTVFAGWNFFGNTAYSMTQSVLNMELNMFGGAVVNAARGIAYQVQASVKQCLDNINIVLNPFSIKTYAEGDTDKLFTLTFLSSKILFSVQLCLSCVLIFLSNEILGIWLVEVPPYTVIFMQLVMINSLIRSVHSPIDILFKAVGDLKYYQIIEGVVLSLPIIFSYFALKSGAPYYVVFVIVIFFELINYAFIILLARKIAHLPVGKYSIKVLLPMLVCVIICALCYVVDYNIFDTTLSHISFLVFALVVCLVLMFFVFFTQEERHRIVSLVKK